MGRLRGGLTARIHTLIDAWCLPIALKFTEGQAHDGRSAPYTLAGVGKGQILLADRAYDSGALHQALRSRGVWVHKKPMLNRKNVLAFSDFLYRHSYPGERFFKKLSYFRSVATRYNKRPEQCLADGNLASVRI